MNRDPQDIPDDMDADMDFIDDEVDMDSISAHPAPPSMLRRAGETLLSLLKTNLVWYVAGFVDSVILVKLFGGM